MKKVLVVEDDTDQRLRLVVGLGKYADRFSVIAVADGKEAIETLKNDDAIGLVVTDIAMPRINGLILMAYIYTYHPDLPCFVMTAYGTSRLKAKLPEDLLRFFHKPFDIRDLATAIEAALDRDDACRKDQGISLARFMAVAALEKSSCVFRIRAPDRPEGKVYFVDGQLYAAQFGEATGEAAALALLKTRGVSYRVAPLEGETVPRQIKTELDELIKNAMVSADGDTCT